MGGHVDVSVFKEFDYHFKIPRGKTKKSRGWWFTAPERLPDQLIQCPKDAFSCPEEKGVVDTEGGLRCHQAENLALPAGSASPLKTYFAKSDAGKMVVDFWDEHKTSV